MMPRKSFSAWINPHINKSMYMGRKSKSDDVKKLVQRRLFLKNDDKFGKKRKEIETFLILKG